MIADKDISLEEALKQDHEFKAAGAYSGDSIAPHSSNMPQSLYESEALMIKDFNRYFIQVLIGNQPSVIWEHNEKYIIFSYDNFDKQFSYVQILDLFGTNKASIKATKRWLDSPRKRSCLGIKFWPSTTAVDPDDPENKLFNTFRGLATKPVENKVLWKIIFRHIYEVTCDKDRRKANHFLNYWAHAVQKTEQKPSFGIAIRGDEEGTGKSIIFEELRKLFGLDNSFSTADPEEIFGANNPIALAIEALLLANRTWAIDAVVDISTTSLTPLDIGSEPLSLVRFVGSSAFPFWPSINSPCRVFAGQCMTAAQIEQVKKG